MYYSRRALIIVLWDFKGFELTKVSVIIADDLKPLYLFLLQLIIDIERLTHIAITPVPIKKTTSRLTTLVVCLKRGAAQNSFG